MSPDDGVFDGPDPVREAGCESGAATRVGWPPRCSTSRSRPTGAESDRERCGAGPVAVAADRRRFFRHKLAVAALAILVLFLLLAFFADTVSPYEYNPPLSAETLQGAREGPSWDHIFGTDKLGRDQFTRVLHALQNSLLVGFGAALLSVLFGVVVGAIAGYYGGWLDQLLMRFTDLVLVLPVARGAADPGQEPRPDVLRVVRPPTGDRGRRHGRHPRGARLDADGPDRARRVPVAA